MKLINLLLAGFLLFGISCSKDEPENELTLKDKLLGKWIEVSPCDSCTIITFSNNDTVYEKSVWDEILYPSFYEVIATDSIMINRNWEIEESKKKTSHKVIFYSDDTLEIKLFTPIENGMQDFRDIKITRFD